MMRIPHLALAALLACCGNVPSTLEAAKAVPPSEPAPQGELPGPTTVTARDRDDGVEFTLRPVGIVFEAPPAFLGHLYSGPSLSDVSTCDRSWDHEYSDVANAAIPFKRLVLQTGAHRFCGGSSFRKSQMRAYLVDEPESAVAKSIRQGAAAALARIPHAVVEERPPRDPAQDPGAPRTSYPGWTYVPIGYSLRFGDYGGSVALDYFVRREAGRTVVLLFMYVEDLVGEKGGVRIDPIARTVLSVRTDPASATPPTPESLTKQRDQEAFLKAICACQDLPCVNQVYDGSKSNRPGRTLNGRLGDCINDIRMNGEGR